MQDVRRTKVVTSNKFWVAESESKVRISPSPSGFFLTSKNIFFSAIFALKNVQKKTCLFSISTTNSDININAKASKIRKTTYLVNRNFFFVKVVRSLYRHPPRIQSSGRKQTISMYFEPLNVYFPSKLPNKLVLFDNFRQLDSFLSPKINTKTSFLRLGSAQKLILEYEFGFGFGFSDTKSI